VKSGGLLPLHALNLHSLNLVCLVFHNLDPVARNRAFEIAGEFLKNDLPPDTFIGLFTLGTRLTAVYPFTQNRKELADAVPRTFSLPSQNMMKMSESVLTANPTHIIWGEEGIVLKGGEVASTATGGAEVSTDTGANLMRGEEAIDRRDFSNITGLRETDRIVTMIAQLGSVPGRKLVLLLTTGLLTTGDPDRFQSMVDRAKASDITFYPIDVSGLTEISKAQAGDLALGQLASVSQTQTAVTGTTSTTQVPVAGTATMVTSNSTDMDQASTDRLQFDTTAATSGLGMSSALLIQRIEPATNPPSGELMFQGKRLIPALTILEAGVNPYAYFVVYPDKTDAAKPKVEVELRVDGNLASTQTLELPEPDSSGAIPMIIRATLHAGRYELKITSVQGNERVTRTLMYSVQPN
jgi:hypothetical protein